MKEIFLKFIICMVVIGVAGGFLFYMAKNDYRERQPATPEQLTAIAQDIPCAADAFRQALQADAYGYRTEVLSIRNARKLAEDCSERERQMEEKNARENEMNKVRKMQFEALKNKGAH
jgi:hypothetical protein